MMQLKIDSPIGKLYLVSQGESLSGIFFEQEKIPLVTDKNAPPVLLETKKQLSEYFSGQRKKFNIPLVFSGTDFQMKVWRELLKIPYGKSISYKDLALRIKNPKAIRAVGTANGKNPLCVIIPCHRVISHDGGLGGYSGGIDKKIKLLDLEVKTHL